MKSPGQWRASLVQFAADSTPARPCRALRAACDVFGGVPAAVLIARAGAAMQRARRLRFMWTFVEANTAADAFIAKRSGAARRATCSRPHGSSEGFNCRFRRLQD